MHFGRMHNRTTEVEVVPLSRPEVGLWYQNEHISSQLPRQATNASKFGLRVILDGTYATTR